MTTIPRPLQGTPRLDAQTYAVGHTAQAGHAFALADLANDAALGHPSQRLTIGRTLGATFHGWYTPSDAIRFVRVTIAVAWRSSGTPWVAGDGVRVELSATDGTSTIASSSPLIPATIGSSPDTLQPTYPAATRISSVAAHIVDVDVDAFAGTLDRSLLWRFDLIVTCDATAACEGVGIEELPRFLVDDAADAGTLPTHFQPRAIIDAGSTSFQRLGETVRWAYYNALRTYHCGMPGETDPYVCTSPAYAPLGQDADDGAARVWTVHPRTLRGASSTGCRVRVVLRYRIVGAGAGDQGYVRLTTGAGSYVVTLTDVSGAWVDASPVTAYLDTTSTKDSLSFDAKRDAGTLSVSARQVFDYPE